MLVGVIFQMCACLSLMGQNLNAVIVYQAFPSWLKFCFKLKKARGFCPLSLLLGRILCCHGAPQIPVIFVDNDLKAVWIAFQVMFLLLEGGKDCPQSFFGNFVVPLGLDQ